MTHPATSITATSHILSQHGKGKECVQYATTNTTSLARHVSAPNSNRSFRYKKRDDAHGTSARRITNALKKLLLGRSMSNPESTTSVTENKNHRESMGSQLSLFRSAFDEDAIGEEGSYRYDVNISYHSNQRDWVENLLIPILENELELKCYIHARDSLPGVSTVKNIAAAVEESRVTILCFSKDYLVSSWQSYEALLAHHMDPAGWKKRIIPIMVENCSLPFKYRIYATLKWPECTETVVSASVKLRRRFFISGLLNVLGVHNKQRALQVYKKYCHSAPQHDLFTTSG